MDFSRANSEPFYCLRRRHEELNRNIKVAFGALELLRVGALSASKLPDKATHLPTGDEPWGKTTRWRNISARNVPHSAKFLSQLGIISVKSTFEDFLVGIEAEHTRKCFLTAAPLKLIAQPPQSDVVKETDETIISLSASFLDQSTS
jgi:hypothetical protein